MAPWRYIRLSARQRLGIAAVIVLLAAAALLILVTVRLRPIVVSMATARVSNTVNRVVVAAVDEAINRGEISYDALVTLEKDTAGRITALKSNMVEFNRLRSYITDDILSRLSDVSESELSIPLGSLTGSALLAGRGPRFRVKLQAVGSVTADFKNTFSAAGINQTKHRIVLDIRVRMSILLPGFTTSTEVSNELSVAETVIVGGVPGTYTYFSTLPEELTEYAEEYIFNNG